MTYIAHLIDAPDSLAKTEALVSNTFEKQDFRLVASSDTGFPGDASISDAISRESAIILLIGPEAKQPLRLARRVSSLIPMLQLVFLLDPRDEQLSKQLSSPFLGIGGNWNVTRMDSATLICELQGIISSALRRYKLRTTLHSISEKLSQTTEREVLNLRRFTQSIGFMSSIIENANDAIVTTTLDGIVVSWNKMAEKFFGPSGDKIIGSSIFSIMEGETQLVLSQQISQLLEDNSKKSSHEISLIAADGERIYVDLKLSVVLGDRDEPIGIAGIFRDISERKKSELALEAARDEADNANRVKSEFLSSMSHELRTPMNSILGFGQLLQTGKLTEEQSEFTYEILKAGYHLLELIDGVLDLAKVEAGQVTLSLEAIELRSIVEESVDLVKVLAQKREIRISNHCQEGVAVRADHTRLKQVLINLLSNAIKYNREGGTVSLSSRADKEGRVRFSVTDTGWGIPDERLPELFQAFSRLDAENSNIEGTGIGLYLTKQLVELMGGKVEVASSLGVGTTFTITLPQSTLSRTESSQPRSGKPFSEAASEPEQKEIRHTVLYIEDNPANLKLVSKILSQKSCIRLRTAHTPALGLDLLRSDPPDLLLLDINLPGMDGYELLRVIKADENLRSLPVVAITASARPKDIERGKSVGFAEYLTKPLAVSRFLEVVDGLLR